MATAKKYNLKNSKKAPDEIPVVIDPKLKRVFDLEEEAVIPGEKVIEDAEVLEDGTPAEDPEEEEAALDDDELDPFKDKWEQ